MNQARPYPSYPASQVQLRATDEVYTRIKREILCGEIEPGSLLSESKLAERFGVSRTPVREALSLLASDGLITTLPQRGHLVHTVSLSEVLDAFRVREILEVEAAGLAVHRISDAEIVHLRELAEAREGDFPSLNHEFHTIIAKAGGNRVLADFIERLLMLMRRVLLLDPHLAGWTEEGTQEALAICEALAARDEAAAREAMRTHIRNTLASILRQV
ncbi:MAG: GntR family transcriptional regulator [Anaerolineae bacterium]